MILIEQEAQSVINNDAMARTIKDKSIQEYTGGLFCRLPLRTISIDERQA
jgi:hypothetical protein